MPRIKTKRVILSFPGTTEALYFEREAGSRGLPGRLIPLPGSIAAGCGLAWSSPAEQKEAVLALAGLLPIRWEGVYELFM